MKFVLMSKALKHFITESWMFLAEQIVGQILIYGAEFKKFFGAISLFR